MRHAHGVGRGSWGNYDVAKQRRRRRSKKRRRRRPGLILIAMMALLAAGFVTRRVLVPRAMHFLTHRSAASAKRSAFAHGQPANAPGEMLTNSERRALDRVVRERSK